MSVPLLTPQNIVEYQGSLPAAPSSGLLAYARHLGARWPSYMGPNGIDISGGAAPWVPWTYFLPDGNGTNVRILRTAQQTVVGTTTSLGTIATSSYLASLAAVKVVSAATAGSFAEWRAPDLRMFFGNAAGVGGFHLVHQFGKATDASTSDQVFQGLSTAAGALVGSATDPSAMLNLLGVGADSGDTNYSFIHNDGSGTATKVALGADFPKAAGNNVYEMHINCPPNSTTVDWSCHRLDDPTKTPIFGTFSTDMPAVNTLMGWHQWACNKVTAAATAFITAGVTHGPGI